MKALTSFNFVVVGSRGSHRKLAYEHPDTGEKRTVIVPLHDELAPGTLRSIAEQSGAEDFDKFCAWIARNC